MSDLSIAIAPAARLPYRSPQFPPRPAGVRPLSPAIEDSSSSVYNYTGPGILGEFLREHNHYSAENLLTLKALTGGVPKYLEHFAGAGAFDLDTILDNFIAENSLFLEEGKHVLIEEFGRDYASYFAILELISVGKTSRGEIESVIQKSVGGYLDRLEKDYFIVPAR